MNKRRKEADTVNVLWTRFGEEHKMQTFGSISFFVCGSIFFWLIAAEIVEVFAFGWVCVCCFLALPNPKRTTNRRPDLSIITPGRCVARMPGTGPLRRSNMPARKKAILGKSLVEPDRLQRPSFVFLTLARPRYKNHRVVDDAQRRCQHP